MVSPRWLAFGIGVSLLVLGLSMRFAPSVWDGQRWLASDTFSKVGLVLICVWLAWPGLEAIRRAPGGAMLLVACTVAVGLFLYQRKTIWITGPFLLIAIGIALFRGWLGNVNRRR